jgi:putative heme-binding domain-containing protein
MLRFFISICLTLAIVPSRAEPAAPLEMPREIKGDSGPQSTAAWIWKSATPGATEKVFFRREFELPPDVTSAAVTLTCDNWSRLSVNGRDLGMAGEWSNPRTYDVRVILKPGGRNVIAVESRNDGGAAGMALRFRATLKDGKKLHVVSDANWQCGNEAPEGWQNLDFSAAGTWSKAVVVAKMGDAPWGAILPPEAAEADADLPPIKGPGREWTIDEVVKLAESGLDGRDKEHGKALFRAALCAACHRFGNEGEAVGPDLTSLADRFVVRALAEAIVDPSKTVSDQFAFALITRHDGTELTGKIIEEKDEKWLIGTSPLDVTQTTEIRHTDIKGTKHSPVSPMPPGLINRLNPDELKDLLAYLLGK